jgi:hypothetical protein
MLDADVLLWNTVGASGFTGKTPDAGLGGSELELLQIAEGLAERGHRVVAATGVRRSTTVRGVRYVPHGWAYGHGRKVRALYIERCSPPPDVAADRVVVRATDTASPAYCMHMDRTIAVNTHWQATGFRWA